MGQMVINNSILKTVSKVKERNGMDEHMLLSELFPDSFMKERTQYSSIEELFENGLFLSGPDQSADEEDIDGHIFITTDFSSWEEMAETAAKEYLAKERRSG